MSNMKTIMIIITVIDLIVLAPVFGDDGSGFILTKTQTLSELADCTDAVVDLEIDSDNLSDVVISVQNILDTLNTLDTLTGEEMMYDQSLLENLTTASIYDIDLRQMTLSQIDEVEEDNLQENHGNDLSCVSQRQIGEQETSIHTQWRQEENADGYRKDTWAPGVYRYSKFDACPDHFRCALVHMVVLSDGSMAVSDAENYEIRLYSIQGAFLRKLDVLPLEPRHMAYFRDFKIFVRMKNLNGKYIIAEADLLDMTIRTIVEFSETFNWEYACSSPLTVLNNAIYVGCTPYLFIYDVNGTRIQNFTTSERSMFSVFHSEQGSERLFIDAPVVNGMFTNFPTVIDITNEPICSIQNAYWATIGAMRANNTFYAVHGQERFRVKKYGPNCEPEGTLIEINHTHKFVTLAVFGDLLFAQVEGKWRRRGNNMLHVYKLTM